MTEDNKQNENQFYCTNCGKEVSADAKFCHFCGTLLSAETESNPHESIVLKSFPNENEARQVIINLEANNIKANMGLKSWYSSSKEIDVLVRKEDLNRAREVLVLMASSNKPMQLGDIFSQSFTITGKSLKNNLIIAATFIPTAIVIAVIIKILFNVVPEFYNKVTVETAKVVVRDINYQTLTDGKVDSAFNIISDISYVDTSFVGVNDSAWVTFENNDKHIEYRGVITKTEAMLTPIDETDIYATLILLENDSLMSPGDDCEVQIFGRRHNQVLTIPLEYVVYSYQDSTLPEGKEFVYVIKNKKASLREIETGIYDDDFVEIKTGLAAGEKVITKAHGTVELSEGTEIFIGGTAGANLLNMKIIGIIFILVAAMALCFLFYLAANIGVTKSALSEMDGEKIGLKDLFRMMYSKKLLKCVGLFLLVMIILVTFLVVMGIMIGVGSALNKAMGVLAVLLLIPAMPLAIYFYIKWYFAFVAIVDEDTGIIESLKRSSFLVKDQWWRTFGIIMLVSLVIGFTLTLVTMPAMYIFQWDYISASFKNPGLAGNPKVEFEMLKSYIWGMALTYILSTYLQTLIAPVFNAVVYKDLKLRKSDLVVKLNDEEKLVQHEETQKPSNENHAEDSKTSGEEQSPGE